MTARRTTATTDRLARVIARSGRASRREAERLVEEGRVTVNGEIVHHPGHPVRPGQDDLRVDGKPVPKEPAHITAVLFKPRGTVTVREDPDGRPSALDLLGEGAHRMEAVGRLDFDTEGALLVTNDGELKNKLTHPSTAVPRRYMAKVWRTPDEGTLERVQRGITLPAGRTAPCKARVIESTSTGNAWVEITVTEGRDLTIKEVFAAVGHPVSKLRRESFATISLRGLSRGQSRVLTGVEIARIEDIADGVEPQNAGKQSRYKKGYARPKAKKRPHGKKLQAKNALGKRRGKPTASAKMSGGKVASAKSAKPGSKSRAKAKQRG